MTHGGIVIISHWVSRKCPSEGKFETDHDDLLNSINFLHALSVLFTYSCAREKSENRWVPSLKYHNEDER